MIYSANKDLVRKEKGQGPAGSGTEVSWQASVPDLAKSVTKLLAEQVNPKLALGDPDVHSLTAAEVSERIPAEPLFLIGLAVSGSHTGNIALCLSEPTALSLAEICLGSGAQVDDPSQQLDEARSQGIEDLLLFLAPKIAKEVSALTAADIGLVLSDRDRLEGAGQVLDYLKLKDQSRTVLYTALDLHYKAETLGQVHILVPAAVLQDLSGEQLDPGPAQDEQGPDEQQSPRGHRAGVLDPEEVAALISEDDEQGIEDPDQVAQAGAGSEPEGQDQGQRQEIEAHALHITLLQATSHIDEELKAFLGKPLELYDYVARVISKRELLKRFQGKIVVTNLALSGDNYGAAYTAVDLEDAIFLGGSLVMLPKAEINRKIQNGQFREDDSDAFGEIINILAGAFSSAFGNYFPQKVRLKKDRMATVAPTKLDVGTDEPFPDGDYFLATYSMRLGSRPLQSFNIFFSPDLFNLSKRDLESLKKNPVAGNSDAEEGPGYTSLQAEGCDVNRPALAVLAEDLKYGDSIASNLDINDVEVCQAKLRDNLREKLRSLDVMGVFLVMRKIDDNSLASLIKIRSFLKGRCPIIIAAPKWDRAKVIKAVHYGASDIICLPTNKETVQSKTRRLMVN